MGRAQGACARSDKERRRGVATLRRGGETQDQPHNRPVPTIMKGMTYTFVGCGGTAPSPLLEFLAIATAMASSLPLGASVVLPKSLAHGGSL